MNEVTKIDGTVAAIEPQLPAPVARRGITEAQWRTLMNNLFPGAKSDSVLMVWDYCVARKLDPMKKPCHIVPMQVKSHKGEYEWRDVVMPGIYEYRTTATRTGLYMGHSKPAYGPIIEHLGKNVPEWCELTVYRWIPEAKQRAEYPVQLRFEECCATKRNKNSGHLELNQRWATAPQQMLTKCCEAAALREAFPDELGGTHTAEEMEDQSIVSEPRSVAIDPRGDLSGVTDEMIQPYYDEVVRILNQDKEEGDIANDLREHNIEMSKFAEIAIATLDKLAKDKVISKANYRKYLNVGNDRGESHTS